MKIVFNDKYVETISFENLNQFDETFKKFSSINEPLSAKIFVINESININRLSKFKDDFEKINNCSLCLYSNNRNTILAGKFLKINSTFINEKDLKNKLHLLSSNKKEDILHEGTVRSGDRISSNGNLCIIGDVNPGAIVTARENIYVWGKLLGIAFAGKGGSINSTISAIYLNPLQLRIADVIAIGPKDRPKDSYPEIAVVENQIIIIKPYIIETKN